MYNNYNIKAITAMFSKDRVTVIFYFTSAPFCKKNIEFSSLPVPRLFGKVSMKGANIKLHSVRL